MRQLHIREPWAGLAYASEQEMITDLIARVQMLENRIRDLEDHLSEMSKREIEREPVSV
jgi:hypothetical protein